MYPAVAMTKRILSDVESLLEWLELEDLQDRPKDQVRTTRESLEVLSPPLHNLTAAVQPPLRSRGCRTNSRA